jgi:hypothetical protein
MTHAYESLVDGAMNLSLGVVIGVALGYFVVGLMNLSEKKANARVDRLKSVADTPHVSDDDYPPTDLDYPWPDDDDEKEFDAHLVMSPDELLTMAEHLLAAYAEFFDEQDTIDVAETVEITTSDV